MEIVKDIAAIIGCILSVISLLTICSKAGRDFIKGVFSKNTKDLHDENAQQSADIKEIKDTLDIIVDKLDAHEDVAKQQCRNIIKNIYYIYQAEKKIPLYERKTADATYAIYRERFDGNSYAKLLYTEICKWEIDNVRYQNLEE